MVCSPPLAKTDRSVNARHGVMQGKPGAPGGWDVPEVFVDEYLTNVFGFCAARPRALQGLAQEGEEMSDVDYRVGRAIEIEIDQCDAIAVDQNVIRLEVAMDQRGRSALETRGHRLYNDANLAGQIGSSRCDGRLSCTKPGHVFGKRSLRRGDVEFVELGNGARRILHRADRAFPTPDDLGQ